MTRDSWKESFGNKNDNLILARGHSLHIRLGVYKEDPGASLDCGAAPPGRST